MTDAEKDQRGQRWKDKSKMTRDWDRFLRVFNTTLIFIFSNTRHETGMGDFGSLVGHCAIYQTAFHTHTLHWWEVGDKDTYVTNHSFVDATTNNLPETIKASFKQGWTLHYILRQSCPNFFQSIVLSKVPGPERLSRTAKESLRRIRRAHIWKFTHSKVVIYDCMIF